MTVIKNLEIYGIDLKEFAQELQQMAASSTACEYNVLVFTFIKLLKTSFQHFQNSVNLFFFIFAFAYHKKNEN